MRIELFALLPLIPLLGLLPLALLRQRPLAMAWSVLGVALASAALALSVLPPALAQGRVLLRIPALIGELSLALDAVSLLLVILTTVVWCAASLYAIGNLHGANLLRYHLTSLITLSAMLGVLIAGDLLTLYLFFEWLGLTATLFVLHSGTPSALRAAIKYLVLTLLGGFGVLSGALIVQGLGGGSLDAAVVFGPDQVGLAGAAALLLLGGFGVKAGVIVLHLWLPDAHTAAPAPASALLSGLMIKAGAYGILRSVGVLFAGDEGRLLLGGRLAEGVIALGVITMLLGVAMALLQVDAKRLLAYSSVSQMGFIVVGIGSAAYLTEAGAIGWIGALLHIVRHALGKALLFLAVGALVAATGSGDIRDWGGLARRMPLTMLLFMVGALGLAGLPGLGGFVSKSILHHALDVAGALQGAVGLTVAGWIFTLTSVGTAAALWKLFGLAFLGASRAHAAESAREAPWSMRGGMLVLALLVVAMGWRPEVLTPLFEGAMASFGVGSAAVLAVLSGPMATPGDCWKALVTLVLGAPVAFVVVRLKFTPASLPLILSLDRLVLGALMGARLWLRRAEVGFAGINREARRWLVREEEWLKRSEAQGLRRVALWVRLPQWWVLRFEGLFRWLGRRFDRSAQLVELLSASEALPDLRSAALEEAVQRERGMAQERFAALARTRIARLSRDLNLNLSLLFLLWFVFLLLLVLAG